jgi:hypothetical protein
MIQLIIQLLQINEFYAESENIEIAKGKYNIASTFKQSWKKAKREIMQNKKKNV